MPKVVSKGTALKLKIATVLTALAHVRTLTGPDSEVGVADITALDSGVGREFGPTGFVDGGSVTWEAFFDPVAATTEALTDLMGDPDVEEWEIEWSDDTKWPFDGILTKFTPKAGLDEYLLYDGEIKLDDIASYPST